MSLPNSAGSKQPEKKMSGSKEHGVSVGLVSMVETYEEDQVLSLERRDKLKSSIEALWSSYDV